MEIKLSENALRVLERRYLAKDKLGKIIETPDEMFRRVAKAIASVDKLYKYSTQEIKKTEEEFYNTMTSLEFMPNTPTLVNAGRELGQLSACFSPDQIIITKNGPKSISEIKVGDYVLTHQNRFRKVMEVFTRKADSIYSISAYKLPTSTLKITAEHPILAIKKEDKNKSHPSWIQVKDLSVGDYIALAFPEEIIDVDAITVLDFIKDENVIEKNGYLYEKNEDIRTYIHKDGSVHTQNRNRSGEISKQIKPIKNTIMVDGELLRLFGYYLSEGCVSQERCLRFVFSLQERNYAKDVLNIVRNKFGISSRIEETNSSDRKWISIRFHSKILAQFFIKLFGTGYNIKEIPQWIVLLPKEKQKGLLSGMFRGDSCTVKNGNNFCTQLVMCNRQLVYSAWQILARIGVFAGLNFNSMPRLGRVQPVMCRVSGREGTKLINEFLEENFLHNGIEFKREFNYEGRIFTPIVKIVKQDYRDIVYNLEVEGDRSYCANMVSVHNCFVIPIEDSMSSIFEAVKSCALIHRTGGGTGMSFSRLRPKDSIVKTTGGLASGPVSFMKVFDAATHAVRQGGVRRGASMGVLRVDHPDILEFIQCKESDKEITNFNISVAITEDFMQKLEKGEDYDLIDPHTHKAVQRLNTKEVFDLIVKQAHKNGEPGVIFIDRMNEFNPTPALGNIESTNPCVTADTLVATNNGLIPIVKLHNPNKVLTRTGDYHSIHWAKKTARKEVFKVSTKAGYMVKATAEHKFLTPGGWKSLKELNKNDRLILQPNRGFGNIHIEKELALMLGWLIGDGCITKDFKDVIFYFNKDDKLEILPIFKRYLDRINGKEVKVQTDESEIRLKYSSRITKIFHDLGVTPQKRIPESIFQMDEESIKNILCALFSADGSVQGNRKKGVSIRLSSSFLELLKQVQLLLLQFGIFSRIHQNRREAGWRELPDSQRNPKRYFCRAQHELIISRRSMFKFIEKIGFCISSKKLKFEKRKPLEVYKDNIDTSVEEIERIGIEDVYDLSEPITHSFVANGIVVHNCGEVPLLAYESCNLASINLFKMAKKTNGEYQLDWGKLRKVVHLGVHFLDNVIDANKFPLPEINRNTKLTRKIGLGVMGWSSLLVSLGIPYNSEEALALANKVMGFILEEAKKKSMELAKERGLFPAYKGSIWEKEATPLRNATLTTIAPTGTISIIAGPCSSGIEPLFAISYYRNVMDNDKLVEVDPLFEEIAKTRGFYSRELMERIAETTSIQDIEGIPEDVKRIFVTAHDISPEWHVRMQSVFQRFTHNSVSKTINFPHEATVENVRKAYLLAYTLGCKGITIYRDRSREEQVLNVGHKDTKGEGKTTQVSREIAPRPRPEVIIGTTTKVATGCGNLYVTINVDEEGRPFELFTQMGKAGGCAASQLEAIGRLVSLGFRSGIEVKAIIEQLRNIRCPSPSWEKGQRIFSCADAIARVIEKRLMNTKAAAVSVESPQVPMKHSYDDETIASNIDLHGDIVGVCPDCGGTLRHEEGCVKCHACGFSKC